MSECQRGSVTPLFSAQKILFVRTDTIGDSVLASAILPPLRAAYPKAIITVLCQQHIAELYEYSPYINSVIPFDFMRAYQSEAYRELICRKMQTMQPDLVLNSLYSRELLNEYLTLASGGRRIVGFNGDASEIREDILEADNRHYQLLVSSKGRYKTELDRYADFLRELDVAHTELTLNVWTTAADEAFADSFFIQNGLDSQRTLAFFPTGRHRKKYYPHYAEVLEPICMREGLTLLLLGAEYERELLEELAEQFTVPTIRCGGELSLRQMTAILKRCRLAVGADTGTAHIACAVGTPNVVVLWGGHFGRFFPYSSLTSVVCLPLACYGCNWRCRYERWHCVADIAPVVLSKAVEDALLTTSQKPRIYFQPPDAWLPQGNQPEWEMFEKFVDYRKVELVVVR